MSAESSEASVRAYALCKLFSQLPAIFLMYDVLIFFNSGYSVTQRQWQHGTPCDHVIELENIAYLCFAHGNYIGLVDCADQQILFKLQEKVCCCRVPVNLLMEKPFSE